MPSVSRPMSPAPLRHDKPIALRLTDEERQRALQGAQQEGRSASNFARQMFLRGLAEFERRQTAQSTR